MRASIDSSGRYANEPSVSIAPPAPPNPMPPLPDFCAGKIHEKR